MLPTEPKVGWVFRYSSLWHWQFVEGREEGDKDRPALVLAIVAHLDDGTPAVRVLPITHSPPKDADEAIEIPSATKPPGARRRALLDCFERKQPVCLAGPGHATGRQRHRLFWPFAASTVRRGQAALY